MPGEVIDRPNPQPLASNIPEDVCSLSVKLEASKLEASKLDEATSEGLQVFRRAANYIAACKRSNQTENPSRIMRMLISLHQL